MRILSIITIAISGAFFASGPVKLAAQQSKSVSTYSTLDDASNFVFEPQIVPNVQVDRFQWGFDAGFRYDDNLFLASEGLEEDGYTYNFSPDVLLTVLGDQYTAHLFTLGYGADLLFGDGTIDDTVDVNQDASAIYRFQSDRSRFSLRGNYSRIAGITGTDYARSGDNILLREIGRARSDRFGVTGDFDYRLSSRVSLNARYGYQDVRYDGLAGLVGAGNQNLSSLNDSTTHGGQIGLNFGSDRLHFGPYIGFERLEAEDNASQDAYQAGGQVTWEYSALTSFFAQLGYDERSFNNVNNAASDRNSFVYSAGLDWHPSAYFSSRLSLSRSILPSAILDNQNFEQTSIDWGMRRDFFEYYFARVAATYAWIDYDSNVDGLATIGSENYFSGYFELGRRLADWGSASVYYRYLENDADTSNRSYENNTVGLRLSVDF